MKRLLSFTFSLFFALPFLFLKPQLFKDKGAILCSFLLGVGLQLQTIGIAETTLAKSGFLTVFYALFTPILTMIFFKDKFKPAYWGLLLMSLVGIAMICDFSLDNFNKGDIFILFSAFAFALHIMAVDQFAKGHKALFFNFAQCFYIGLFGLAFAFIYDGPVSLAPLFKSTALAFPSALYGTRTKNDSIIIFYKKNPF
mgnify:CR=1 FL=1